MKGFASLITVTSLFPLVFVQSQVDKCDYQINSNTDPNLKPLIGVYLSEVNLSVGQSLLVSYYWQNQQLTEQFSNVNTTIFLNRTQARNRCFDDSLSIATGSIFWSEEPITITQNPHAKYDVDCTNPVTVYSATYFQESCGSIIELSSLSPYGSFSFPNNWATSPCLLTACTWFIQCSVAGSTIGIWVKNFTGSGGLRIADTLTNRACIVIGQDGFSDLYVSDFGTNVSISYSSSAPADRFTVEYKLINQSTYRDMECSVGNETVDSCICSGSLLYVPTERVDNDKEITPLSEHYKRDGNIINVTAMESPQQLRCSICAEIVNTTTAMSTMTTSMSTTHSAAAASTTTTSSSKLPTTTTSNDDDQDLSHFKVGMNVTNVAAKLRDLSNALLNIKTRLSPKQVYDCVEVLSVAAALEGISPEAGQYFDEAADITLGNGSESFTHEITNKLLNAVKNYGINVNLTVGQSSDFSNGSSFANIVTVVNCSATQFQVGLIDLKDEKNATSVAKIFNDNSSETYLVKGMVGYIAIEQHVICSNESQETGSEVLKVTKVSFQIYRTTNIFATAAATSTSITRSSYCEQTYPGDVVVSATVVKPLNSQTKPQMSVRLGFQRSLDTLTQAQSRNYRTYCGFWQTGNWVDNTSVRLINQSGEAFIFQADHLTDFTLLTSSSSKERIFCESSLDLLGTVGSSCSFAGLTFMSISLLIIWLTGLSTNTIVLLSLSFNIYFALFFICFILFADQFTLNISGPACTAFAAVMYYLLISTMMWTCCRAALVYKRYVIVFDIGGSSKIFTFNKLSTFVSTATPLVVVLTVVFTDNDFFERQDHFCWINPSYVVYAIVIPIAVMLIMSIIVLIMVIRRFFFSIHPELRQSKTNDRKSFRRKIWVLFVIQISLGLPWIFLYLTEIPGTSVFHYLFTITNAFQGVWIAALHFYERRKDLGKMLRQATHSSATQTSLIDTRQAAHRRRDISTVTQTSLIDTRQATQKIRDNSTVTQSSFSIDRRQDHSTVTQTSSVDTSQAKHRRRDHSTVAQLSSKYTKHVSHKKRDHPTVTKTSSIDTRQTTHRRKDYSTVTQTSAIGTPEKLKSKMAKAAVMNVPKPPFYYS